MLSREAYETILRALEADSGRQLVDSEFNDAVFGNFAISFEEEGVARTVVNDRGQLVLYTGPNGAGGGTMILPSLVEADEQAVLGALGL